MKNPIENIVRTGIIKRWMTEAGTIRVLGAEIGQTVRDAMENQPLNRAGAEFVGEFLVGGALLELALAPADRVLCTLDSDGPIGSCSVDVWPGGALRARVDNPTPDVTPLVGPNAILRVSRQPARGGEVYTTAIPMPGDNIGDAFQLYALQSEQVLSFIALRTTMEGESLERATGLLVQALPGMVHEDLAAITACLEQHSFSDLIGSGATIAECVDRMFGSLSMTFLGADPVGFRCRCSRESAVAAVRSLSEEDLQDLQGGGTEEVECEYCGTTYHIQAADLA